MSFTPFARYRNFTLANLKSLLEVYPDMAGSISWDFAKDLAEERLKGYKRTAEALGRETHTGLFRTGASHARTAALDSRADRPGFCLCQQLFHQRAVPERLLPPPSEGDGGKRHAVAR